MLLVKFLYTSQKQTKRHFWIKFHECLFYLKREKKNDVSKRQACKTQREKIRRFK